MRITSSWTRGVRVNRMGGESPGELGGGGACLERVLGQVPPSRPSCGQFRQVQLCQWGGARLWELGVSQHL